MIRVWASVKGRTRMGARSRVRVSVRQALGRLIPRWQVLTSIINKFGH